MVMLSQALGNPDSEADENFQSCDHLSIGKRLHFLCKQAVAQLSDAMAEPQLSNVLLKRESSDELLVVCSTIARISLLCEPVLAEAVIQLSSLAGISTFCHHIPNNSESENPSPVSNSTARERPFKGTPASFSCKHRRL